jgi:hypothetical protein
LPAVPPSTGARAAISAGEGTADEEAVGEAAADEEAVGEGAADEGAADEEAEEDDEEGPARMAASCAAQVVDSIGQPFPEPFRF